MTERWLAAATVLLVLAGCSVSDADEQESWDSLDVAAVTRDSVAAVYLIDPDVKNADQQRGGSIAFLDAQGDVTTLQTGWADNGRIAMSASGDVAWASEDDSFLLRGENRYRHRHGGVMYTEAMSIVDGRVVQVLDDVETTDDGRTWTRSSLPATGQVGLDGTAVLGASDWGPPGTPRRTLWSVVPGGSPRKVATWKTAGDPTGERLSMVSRLFASAGRAWFLEDVRTSDGSRLSLASVDLRTGKYRSTVVRRWAASSQSEAPRGGNHPAGFYQRGHLHEGRLFFVDGTGHVCGASLETARLSCAPRVLPDPSDTDEDAGVETTWSGGELVMLTTGGSPALERFDIVTGKRTSRIDVPGLQEFLDAEQRNVASLAVR
ncbi:hypothetical protein [Aeromicrobium sp. Root495]|uniref:hypothetical protein n=1 Tax=Aeromicrobium sp. Root495 TaxID=1736550 RepID=UPI000A911B26|nr:hypothetical protein [Aeromicrobium sp. Root495]